MSRVCDLSGTRANNGMAVSHSHIRTKKITASKSATKKALVGRGQEMDKGKSHNTNSEDNSKERTQLIRKGNGYRP